MLVLYNLQILEKLEKEHNWYAQRVVKLPEGVSFTALKKAVAAFIQENESIEDDDLEEEPYGYDKIGEDGDIDFPLGTMTAELS